MVPKRKRLAYFFALLAVFAACFGLISGVEAASKTLTPVVSVQNPGILPTSPFYFLKEWRRALIRSLTSNPISRASFELDVLDEKAVEMQKMKELNNGSEKTIAVSIGSYAKSLEDLKTTLNGPVSQTANSDKKQRLTEEVSKEVYEHSEYLSELSSEYAENDRIVAAVQNVSVLSLEVVGNTETVSQNASGIIGMALAVTGSSTTFATSSDVLANSTTTADASSSIPQQLSIPAVQTADKVEETAE